MKYKDVIIVFLSLIFILSLAYSLGVNLSFWILPAVFFLSLIYSYYKLYIEK
jgi:hypothetical protein